VIDDVDQRPYGPRPNRQKADAMGFCREVVECLRLPPPFVNPMCLRTFLGHLRAQGAGWLGGR
jgi:hypothetical protein